MISSIDLCPNHGRMLRTREKKFYFESGYNAIIGPNAYGKSTILESLSECFDCSVDRTPSTKLLYITSESLNPNLNLKGCSSLDEMVFALRAKFSSFGEIGKFVMRNRGYCDEEVLLVDSPEIGQDQEGLNILLNGFLRFVERGKQVIISTHNLTLMKKANIISLKRGYLQDLMKATEESLNELRRVK